jgi:hypothetical protein
MNLPRGMVKAAAVEPRANLGRLIRMSNAIGELLFGLVRILVGDWLKQAAAKVCAWLDTKVHGRIARIVLGGLLGIAAYFIFPIIMGLFSL